MERVRAKGGRQRLGSHPGAEDRASAWRSAFENDILHLTGSPKVLLSVTSLREWSKKVRSCAPPAAQILNVMPTSDLFCICLNYGQAVSTQLLLYPCLAFRLSLKACLSNKSGYEPTAAGVASASSTKVSTSCFNECLREAGDALE